MNGSETARRLGLDREPRAVEPELLAAIAAAPLTDHQREILRYLTEMGEGSVDDVRRTGRIVVKRVFVRARASHAEILRLLEGLAAHELVSVEPDAGHTYLWLWRPAPRLLEQLAGLVLEEQP